MNTNLENFNFRQNIYMQIKMTAYFELHDSLKTVSFNCNCCVGFNMIWSLRITSQN